MAQKSCRSLVSSPRRTIFLSSKQLILWQELGVMLQPITMGRSTQSLWLTPMDMSSLSRQTASSPKKIIYCTVHSTEYTVHINKQSHNIYTPHRSSLSSKNGEMLMFLNFNIWMWYYATTYIIERKKKELLFKKTSRFHRERLTARSKNYRLRIYVYKIAFTNC